MIFSIIQRKRHGEKAGRAYKPMNKRKIGAAYENLAAVYLEKQGYEILERNYRCRSGEIDLIAREKETLVFVEVKYRSSLREGDPLEAVNRKKQRIISRVARYYLLVHPEYLDISCRFDVVGVLEGEIRLLRNAFESLE